MMMEMSFPERQSAIMFLIRTLFTRTLFGFLKLDFFIFALILSRIKKYKLYRITFQSQLLFKRTAGTFRSKSTNRFVNLIRRALTTKFKTVRERTT